MKGSEYVPGLDNLTSKIIQDAKKRAAEITGEAESQAKSAVEAAVAEATREKERILAEAEAEAARTAERITLGRTLAVRDENLGAKQQMLEKVFSAALEKLNAMPREDYEKFLLGYLKVLNPDGGELILPEKYAVPIDAVNDGLKKAGLKGNLTMSAEKRPINGGFILCRNGIEQNNTFESLVGYYRYELEGEVLKQLY